MIYTNYGGEIPAPYNDFLNYSHLLIAGSTGSGKSVVINGMIRYLLNAHSNDKKTILIDPKRIELKEYYGLPHVMRYAAENEDIYNAMKYAESIMMNRYKTMHDKIFIGPDLYVFIDEYADLMITDRKRITPIVLRIAQLGRAAKVHLVLATQRPTTNIITGDIKVNMDYRLALHVPTAQDSRNIIGVNDAASLPMNGYGLLYCPSGLYKVKIPMVPQDEIDKVIEYYHNEINKNASWLDKIKMRMR